MVTGYLHHLGISVIPYLDDWLVHHSDRQVMLRHQVQLLEALDLVGFIQNRKKSELDLVQDIQFLRIRLGLEKGNLAPRVQSSGDSGRSIFPSSSVLPLSVPIYGLTQLGIRSFPLGCLHLRPLQRYFHSIGLTDRFMPPRRSDPLVLASLLQQRQDLSLLTSGIPNRPFQAEFTIFTDASTQGWGAHMGDSQISGTWTPLDRELHINCLELKAVGADLQHRASVLQGHQVSIVTDNSTIVYISTSKEGPVPIPCYV